MTGNARAICWINFPGVSRGRVGNAGSGTDARNAEAKERAEAATPGPLHPLPHYRMGVRAF
jgi:hypothetical protein